MTRVSVACSACAVVALIAGASRADAATLEPLGSFDQPTFVTSDPADPDRLFVVERAGPIVIVQGSTTSLFVDLTPLVACCTDEEGLLSMALPPDFPETGIFFVDYTGTDGAIHVDELRASGGTASLATRRPLLTIPHPGSTFHYGGQLQIGPDGALYISTGDGEDSQNAQSTGSLLGKLLRIDPNPSGTAPYSIPPDNPFAGGVGAEIWSLGLRNPWRFSFDRLTGDLTIGDVGRQNREEVDFAPLSAAMGRGLNFGWDCREGSIANPVAPQSCAGLSGFTDPVFDYPHSGGRCAIIGGYVARDPTLGDLFGRYLYTDLCLGDIRSLALALPSASADRSEGLSVSSPDSFGQDSCGRLYVAETGGSVFHLAGAGDPICTVLHVSVAGGGTGMVSGQGIGCPVDCVEVFPSPDSVQLGANPGPGSFLESWQGACTGHDGCSPTMSEDRSVLAVFSKLRKTHVRLRLLRRPAERGDRAKLRVKVFPCKGRRGDRVRLLRGGRRVDRKKLSRRCTARFGPRINHRSRFRAKVRADRTHRRGRSRRLRVKPGGRSA